MSYPTTRSYQFIMSFLDLPELRENLLLQILYLIGILSLIVMIWKCRRIFGIYD